MLPASPSCPAAARHEILELARFLTELSVIDYFFVTRRASSTALAALLNAIDTIGSVDYSARIEFVEQLNRLDGFDPFDAEIEECRIRLRELYLQGGYSRPETTDAKQEGAPNQEEEQQQEEEPRTETISPVCVASAFDAFKAAPMDANPSKTVDTTGMNHSIQTNERHLTASSRPGSDSAGTRDTYGIHGHA